jgi:ABC-2 type transport system permease protein
MMTMTTTAGPYRPQAPAGHYRFRHAARMEWIKLTSLRSTIGALLFGVAAMIGIGIAAGFNTKNPHGDVTNNILVGIALGQVVFGALGVLTMTSEYSSGMIRATLAAIPRRTLLMAAKATVFGLLALAAGELATFAAFLAGAAFVRSGVPQPALSQPGVLRAVGMSGAYLALIGLIGLGLGAIIRHGAAAIATLIGLVFVAPLAGLALTPAGKFLPELIAANSLGATQPVTRAGMLPPWAGLGIICGYAAVLLAAGGWLLVRRDA